MQSKKKAEIEPSKLEFQLKTNYQIKTQFSVHRVDMTEQLTSTGRLQHLLSIEGLPQSIIDDIFVRADKFIDAETGELSKASDLTGMSVANLFYEMSTRTRTTFELAEKRLCADVLNLGISDSSTGKGESIDDTVLNLNAMGCDIFVIRQSQETEIQRIAKDVLPHCAVINAGDGTRAHPTQALLDLYTIRHFKGAVSNLDIAIIGDIEHSRVAHSELEILKTMCAKSVRLIGPEDLLDHSYASEQVSVHRDIEQGIAEVDVVITLRIQKERMQASTIPNDAEYFKRFGLTQERLSLAKPDAIVMHPGPMNRGVEISDDVADGPQSVILNQVRFGIAVRMAILSMVQETLKR